MRDFSLHIFTNLISALRDRGFIFITFESYLSNNCPPLIILRHDVDSLPLNSLNVARFEAAAGVKGTYYFRTFSIEGDVKIINEISNLGHEIGYHYEDLSIARQKIKVKRQKLRNGIFFSFLDPATARPQDRKTARLQDFEKELADIAFESFSRNLQRLREIAPVTTICMHGSPMSRWDSRLLWKYYDYHEFGIIGEPYFDIDFNEVLYLTDTGRRWDGEAVAVRDKAEGRRQKAEGENWKVKENGKTPSAFSPPPSSYFPGFHSTFDIIRAAEEGKLPDKIMMTFHPQRWTDKTLPWIKELVWQNVKNVAKYFIVKLQNDEETK